MNSFWDGFEKRAFLASMWKNKPKMLDTLASKVLKTRVKNTPNVTFGEGRVRDFLKSGPLTEASNQHLRTLPASMHTPQGMYFAHPSQAHLNPHASVHVLPPESKLHTVLKFFGGKKGRAVSEGLRNPQSRAALSHHELDELNSYRNKPGFLMKYAPSPGQKKNFPQVASHASPSVLINESNRVFHEMGPEAQSHFKSMRAGGETELLKRHGLRYGDEYVQPGTRRYNKLVKNIEARIQKDEGKSEKIFRRGDKKLYR